MGSYYSSDEKMAINHIAKSERKEPVPKGNDRKLAKRKAARRRQRINKKQRTRGTLTKAEMPGTFPSPSPPTTPPLIILSDSDDSDNTDSSDDDRNSSSNNRSNKNDNQIIHTTTNKISITERDLLTLQPGRWLNDTIIDYSLKLIEDKFQHNHLISVSGTFFFTKLKLAKERNLDIYSESKTWISLVNLRKSKTWFIPVCQNYHWFLIAVALPFKSGSFVYIMDSLNVNRSSEAKLIIEFLEKLHNVETSIPIRKNLEIYQSEIPRQRNTSDCGLHLLRSFTVSILRRKFITRLMKGNITDQAEIDAFWLLHPVISRHELEYQILRYAMDNSE
ncbi:hypothetical protein [Parasitella parasitica]|uniref:Ubiquitin-like protease family profile domain-containing protein n=1 Tax=Parasitella parasitica TaxID=35722 RepID=A0A0B7MX73_9FUNG|nr:hypothetical protein [Parasitella parasitica]